MLASFMLVTHCIYSPIPSSLHSTSTASLYMAHSNCYQRKNAIIRVFFSKYLENYTGLQPNGTRNENNIFRLILGRWIRIRHQFLSITSGFCRVARFRVARSKNQFFPFCGKTSQKKFIFNPICYKENKKMKILQKEKLKSDERSPSQVPTKFQKARKWRIFELCV